MAVTPVRLEPAAPLSRVNHSTTDGFSGICVNDLLVGNHNIWFDKLFSVIFGKINYTV